MFNFFIQIIEHLNHRLYLNMSKKQLDYELAFGDYIDDEIERRLIIEAIQEVDEQDINTKNKQNNYQSYRIGEGYGATRMNLQQLFNQKQQNFNEELDIEGGKKYRSFKQYQPEKFKLLGFNKNNKPLFKLSDLYLVDLKVKTALDRLFNDIVYGSSKNNVIETGDLSKKQQKGYDFSKLIQQWGKKEYEDFTNNKKNMLNEHQLEQIVANRGDSKNNYWIYKTGQKNRYHYQDCEKKLSQNNTTYYNHNLMNPQFPINMQRAADRMRIQYASIEQFQSEEQSQNKMQAQQEIMVDTQNKKQSQQYWGQFKDQKNIRSEKRKKCTNYALIEQELNNIGQSKKDQGKGSANENEQKAHHQTFIDQIIKQYSTANQEILANSYKGKQSLKEYNRVQFHLQNSDFFLTKLHYTLQKKSEQFSNFVDSAGQKNQRNKNLISKTVFGDNSILSGSMTGNPKTSQDQQLVLAEDDDHQTIQNKILRQMNSQPRRPINHSEVATKLYYIKFSNEAENFKNYHRFEFRYDSHFEKKTKVSLLRNLKPLKSRGADFNINVEKKDSYTKFSKPQSLSLASGDTKQFVVVEYIEENPLLMSDVGMCQRIILQVNWKQMLQKINRDIIQEVGLQAYEDLRDNPNKKQNTTTEHKMDLWRKNIRNYFGENGKVYLWQQKRQSKLIGNPDGLGIALMESNLAATPIVKKTPNRRDFLLVREKDKWVLRKIESAYVSGQVQPKQVVYSPGDRPYQTFLEKFQIDFLTKYAMNSPNNKISIEGVKNLFPNTPQTSAESRIRKTLKNKMNSQSKDNKIYQIKLAENEEVKFKIDPEQYCLFQRMQKSVCDLESCGIKRMKSMEKMKSILRKYFRKIQTKDIEHFAASRMIRDQLQLTSWYLTESFRKFIDKNARIQMQGHADPTNGHGGYSYIKKPQKQRTDKDQVQERQEKSKLSGTQYDLRKLIKNQSISLLQQQGYSRQQLNNLGRWDLVSKLKNLKDTEYARKERETKEEKEQNEKKDRSRALNKLLKFLKNEQQGLIEGYEYNFISKLDLEYYKERERQNYKIAKEKLERVSQSGQGEDEIDD